MRSAPRRSRTTSVLAALVLLAFAPVVFDCSLTSLGITPLPDLGPGTYLPGYVGGLYPNGSNQRPAGHLAAGLAIAGGEILPRNASGGVDLVNGKIVLISIGMSNTTQEFNGGPWAFKARADLDPTKNPRLVIVDGAQGGNDVSEWAQPTWPSWAVLANRLSNAGVSPAQVQVLWMKHAEAGDGVAFGPPPANVDALATDLTSVLNLATAAYPNLRLAFLSNRTRSYNPTREPFAFENALGVRQVIAAQLSGSPALQYAQPGAVAPWLSWGPYLWADGTTPRSDGFVWNCSDLDVDFTHPATPGETKVADQLLAFYKTDPLTRGWFLRGTTVGSAPALSVTPSVASGIAPLTVNFTASASDADGSVTQIAWNYDDGLYAWGASPTKIFPAPGTYDVRTTASDDDGNTTTVSTTITVGAGTNPWTDLGFALAGTAGPPALLGTGSLLGGTPVKLALMSARASAPVALILGLSQLGAPFKGGTLVPAPDVLILGLHTNPAGNLQLSSTWPSGLQSGLSLWFQEWITDPAGPAGFAASNALRAVTP